VFVESVGRLFVVVERDWDSTFTAGVSCDSTLPNALVLVTLAGLSKLLWESGGLYEPDIDGVTRPVSEGVILP